MQNLISLSALLILVSCSSKDTSKHHESIPTDQISTTSNSNFYKSSTYDDSQNQNSVLEHKAGLKRIFNAGTFNSIHAKQVELLPSNCQAYFKSNRTLSLLFHSKGDLFQNSKTDYCLIIYDQVKERISITLYDELINQYKALYTEIKVENLLDSTECSTGGRNTLDYQLGQELIYRSETLIADPDAISESPLCDITNLTTNDIFIFIEDGCSADKLTSVNSLCISTSSVYNNWNCMNYDKQRNIFVILYGQEFAD